jgi:predicted RecA/RadA family phage recombinase
MAKNYIKPGVHLTFTATAATASGAVVLIGPLIGVSLTKVDAEASGEAAVEGVWELPKIIGGELAVGATPFWDVSEAAFAVSGAATAGDIVGGVVVTEAAASADATVKVKLLPGAGAVSSAAG